MIIPKLSPEQKFLLTLTWRADGSDYDVSVGVTEHELANAPDEDRLLEKKVGQLMHVYETSEWLRTASDAERRAYEERMRAGKAGWRRRA